MNKNTYFYRNHILQADSNEILNAWILALHKQIDAAIQDSKDSDHELNTVNNLPGVKRIQKMYVIKIRFVNIFLRK